MNIECGRQPSDDLQHLYATAASPAKGTVTPTAGMPGSHLSRCPCCKDGCGWLFVWSEDFPDEAPQRLKCNHCDGKGEIPIEEGNDQ